MKAYTTSEVVLLETLLKKVPRGVDGVLPIEDFEKDPAWEKLIKNHTRAALAAKLRKIWNTSVMPITPVAPPKESLNHAYNYCPNCAFKLN